MTVSARASIVFGLGVALTMPTVAPAQVPPAIKFLIGGLNAQLPQKLDEHTVLTRLKVDGDSVDVLLTVEPGSPLAAGIDVRHETARLCGTDVFRTLTAAMTAKLRVIYVKPDKTPVGNFVIDRSICRS